MTAISKRRAACRVLGAVLLAMGMSGAAIGEEGKGHDWHYSAKGNGDDSSWGGVCATGLEQSPINIPEGGGGGSGPVRPIKFNYGASEGATITNNGHTVVVTPAAGNSVEIGGETYKLAQFHFHTQSEHQEAGNPEPMELHLVHVDAAGKPKLVVGVLIDDHLMESDTPSYINNATASRLLNRLVLPAHKGDTHDVDGTINLMDLLPISFERNRGEHIEYKGSLTTPGCNEGLTWIVMLYRLHTTPEVIAKYHKIMGDNFRRPQPINDRPLLCCGGKSETVFSGK